MASKNYSGQFIDNLELNQWMFESSPDCVKVMDLEGRLVNMNWNGLCAMEIDSFDSVCLQSWDDLWPESSTEEVNHALEMARRGGMGRFSAFCPTAKGTPKWWDVMVTPIRNSGGGVERILAVSRDITATHVAQEEQKLAAARLQFLIQSAGVGEWEVNLATGQSSTSLLHDHCFGYTSPIRAWGIENFLEHVHEWDRQRVSDAIKEGLAKDKGWQLECRVVWPDHSVHWISASGSVYYSGERNDRRAVGTVADITRRKRDEALAEGQKRALELAVADAPIFNILDVLTRAVEAGSGYTLKASVLLLDEDGQHLRLASAPSIPSAYLRATDGVVIGPRAGACGSAAFTREPVVVRDIENDPRFEGLHDVALSNGLRSCWSQPILSSQGKVLGTLAVYRDQVWEPSSEDRSLMELLLNTTALILDRHQEVVERRRAELNLRRAAADLEEANTRKTEFLATLAHELRNPLAPILSGLEVMELAGGDTEIAGRARAVMKRQAVHMSHLIDDLLDIARITSGKLDLKKDIILMQEVVSSAVETSLPLIQSKNHHLDVQVADQPLYLHADPTRVAQVVSNLLNNAAKYTPAGGRIVLAVRPGRNNSLVIAVTDNGIGLPASALTSVFEMFAQVDEHVDKSQGGLGIGLTLVRKIAELHGGSVSVTSPGAGMGSTFSVELPLAPADVLAHLRDAEEPVSESHSDPHGLRVMIVDDNVDAGETLASLLSMSGHHPYTACTGYEAIKMAEECAPDAVFLDLGLPDISGYEVARIFRSSAQMKDKVIIALTGWGSESDRAQSRNAGFNYHLTKPTSLTVIKEILDDVSSPTASV